MKTFTFFRLHKLTLGIALFLLFAGPTWAQDLELSEEQQQHIAAQIEETKELLDLSDEQSVAVESILTDSFTERIAIMDKYGINPSDPNFKRPGMSTMRRMGKDMEKVRKNTNKQLGDHLTSDQMETWETLEEERAARMRERMMNR